MISHVHKVLILVVMALVVFFCTRISSFCICPVVDREV